MRFSLNKGSTIGVIIIATVALLLIALLIAYLIFYPVSGKKEGKITLQDSTTITKIDSVAEKEPPQIDSGAETVASQAVPQKDSLLIFTSTTPWNLAKMINDKKAEKEKWNKEVDEIQKIVSWLYRESQGLRPDNNQGPDNNQKWQAMLNTAQPTSPVLIDTLVKKITEPIINEVRKVNKNLNEHRAGARASHNQAVVQRNQIQDQLDNLDTQIALARGELATAKEELKQALKSGDQTKIDHQMQNLQLRLEALERLQKISK